MPHNILDYVVMHELAHLNTQPYTSVLANDSRDTIRVL
ncbi:MAG: M48 family metallopeptidase [Bacteroidetes bacterium]|nr:M48 family metallopeptidase [Bacteroidota bacterium]